MPFLDETGLARLVLKIREKFATKDVATSSKDGLMSVDDKKRLDGINDYTTGINLVRGTRDLILGKNVYQIGNNTNTGFTTDGFYINGTTGDERYVKDNEGFTEIILTASGLTAAKYQEFMTSTVTGLKRGDKLTICVEVMVEDVDALSNDNFCSGQIWKGRTVAYRTQDTVYRLKTVINQQYGESLQSGKWYKVVLPFTVEQTTEIEPEYFFAANFHLYNNGTIHFKKPCVYAGEINKPIWSPSPFDIGDINDYTTGINLLRGTRDFRKYTTLLGNQTPNDGFMDSASLFSYSKDEYGFTIATSSGSGTSYLNAQAFPVKKGDVITFSFDIRADDMNGFTRHSPASVELFDASMSRVEVKDIYTDNDKLSISEEGKWYTIVYTVEITQETVVYAKLRVIGRSGIKESYRKLKAEFGKINHPIWSPSPFDTDYINDETTGINLLRGTRDFTLGHIVAKPLSATYKDGFSTSGNAYLIREDGNGFKYIAPDNSANCVIYTNVIYDVKQGDELTLVFDGNISSQRVNENRYVITINEYSDDSTTRIDFADVLPSHLGVTSNGYIEGTREYVYRFKIKNANTTRIVIPLTLYSSYPVLLEVGKIAVYRGSINNPIWSASPFDVAQEGEVLRLDTKTNALYPGMMLPGGNTEQHIRTTKAGLIPITNDTTFGSGQIGTATYPFKSMTAKTFFGNLEGAATSTSNVYDTSNSITTAGIGTICYSNKLTKMLGTFTGSIKIVLPTKTTDPNMVRFKVTIYDYIPNSLCEYWITGYTYPASKNWYAGNTNAIAIGHPDYRNINASITFGITSDDNACVEIGKSTTQWNYSKIVISDVIFSHKDTLNLSDWKIVGDDSVEIVSIAKTVTNPSVIRAIATPSETLTFLKTSSTATTLPSEDLLVGEIPDIDDEESNDSLAPLPSEGRPMMPMPNEDTNEEGDE